jgi:hypothetical protein
MFGVYQGKSGTLGINGGDVHGIADPHSGKTAAGCAMRNMFSFMLNMPNTASSAGHMPFCSAMTSISSGGR